MNALQSIDLLISARWIIPIEPYGTVYENAALAVDNGDILEILSQDEAVKKYHPKTHRLLPDHALIPGLINTHTHAAMTLLRGIGDDMALMPWLSEKIWPIEHKVLSEEFVYDGTLLACEEMIKGGITCFNDMYLYPEATAKAATDFGMRAMIGMVVFDGPTTYARSAAECLEKASSLLTQYSQHPMLSFCIAPHAPYTVSDKSFEIIRQFKEKHDLKLTIHLNETQEEVDQSLQEFGIRPVERLNRLGLIDKDLIAVHAVTLNSEEITLLGQHHASVSHCPVSNLKLACGIAPVAEMLQAGVNVSLGSDGCASNNRQDIFQEMRFASLLSKGTTHNATVLPAYESLTLATLGGAKTLGLESSIGSLIPGKKADLCAIDLSRIEYQPCYDVVSHLVYVCGREAISEVWINGQSKYAVGNLQQRPAKELDKTLTVWQNLILR